MADHIAIYAGSFDPITRGHLDVIARCRRLVDSLIVGIGHNPDKPALFPAATRLEMATALVQEIVDESSGLAPVSVESYEGLTVDFARRHGAVALVRGIRNVTDLANECQLAIANRQVADIETIFIVTGEAYAFTSSSLIRQIAALGGDVRKLASVVPELVIEHLERIKEMPGNPLAKLANDAHDQ
jgi:pantetheine-phosphate adenylyltransferase